MCGKHICGAERDELQALKKLNWNGSRFFASPPAVVKLAFDVVLSCSSSINRRFFGGGGNPETSAGVAASSDDDSSGVVCGFTCECECE